MKRLKKSFRGKIQKLIGEPRLIAKSFALGSFIGVTPLVGMQIGISLLLAAIFRLSKSAIVVGVINTNWTKGLFLYPLNYQLGAWLLGNHRDINIHDLLTGNIFINLYHAGSEVFLSMLIGGFITGAFISGIYYFLILKILKHREKANLNSYTS